MANTAPIFVLTPNVGWTAAITAANTAYDGTGTVTLAWTAGASGGFINKIRFQAMGTNAQTLARVFLNNGATNTTATNNTLIVEAGLPSSASSNVLPIPPFEIPLNLVVQAGYRIYITLATAVAAGYIATVFGGDY